MIGSLICIFLILYQLRMIVKKNSLERATIFYLICAMISPNLNIGGVNISYEILGFLFFLIHYLLIKKTIPVSVDAISFPLYAYTVLVISITLISVLRYVIQIPVVAMIAVIRYVLLFQMARGTNNHNWEKSVDKILGITLFVNMIASFIQLLYPSSVNLFVDLYGKASNAVLYNFQTLGYFNRAVGTFGSPTLLGPFALICFSFYFAQSFSKRKNIYIYIKIVASLVLGVLTLSKTFIIGVPIMTLFILIIQRDKYKLKTVLRFIFFLIVIICLAYFGYLFLTQKTVISSSLLVYYFGMLREPVKALQTRYSGSGNLQDALKVFMNNPLFGVGLGSVEGEFIGDSTYVQMLHNSGIIGIMLMILFIIGVLKLHYKKRNRIAFAVLIVILLIGIGIPIFTEIMSIIPLGFPLSKLTNYPEKGIKVQNCKENIK